jgi:hypothetical protein
MTRCRIAALPVALLVAGCGPGRAVSTTTTPVAGDGQPVAGDGRQVQPRDAAVGERAFFDPCPFTICDGVCVDTSWDPYNCGSCGAECVAGFVCENGLCVCPGSLVHCNGQCVDLTSDTANCGSCDSPCSWGEACVNGACSGSPGPCLSKVWQGHIYLFCQSWLSWADASAACKAAGKHLVTIDNAAENTWVYNEIANQGAIWWWTGFNDLKIEGQWVWEDGSPVSYTSWGDGEPNDAGGAEDCGNIGQYMPMTWNDEVCSTPAAYICEGSMTCPYGLTDCSGTCVDLMVEHGHCGACGNKCNPGEICDAGVCVMVLYDVGCPGGYSSGGGSQTLYLPSGYKKVTLVKACFDDDGYIQVNGQTVFSAYDGCCSAGCHTVSIDVTALVWPGSNTIYGYADDCCGGCASVYAKFDVN